ncbi:MAG: hypothetical protein A2845_03720 [Candidatus Lloydbacteria bacterium RIFCSPHIGHO2_01_FULL_49_22]|uniref:Uncharacterized protein n=1 Tax=Candidatus Lloydbacteria bacterium RIFCSPHIGHO2_01_FULL_49_22 TaxID=1798658 RepID=A0A1G2CX04_9BACT|nr:MAG: hypothetical protein A2845_03720 [Candidatus Lloydbacteria bacterium RIFCSPHIGHO2_01_FULL_49_22]OGZ09037.1 MAG: hypothetical protein A3C14_03555 [Candidatus Lloydbacteria bacterium RIFCSPHIGHO2_02_FULL_50_18]
MRNDNGYERLWKLQAMIGKLVLDGKRDPNEVANTLQSIVDRASPSSHFTLMKTIDIVVPDDYVHATQLATFKRENLNGFYAYDPSIIDANFTNVTTSLVPGRKFRVQVFRPPTSGVTTSEEWLAFLKSQKAVLVGAQGLSLVYAAKREELPKHYVCVSLDEKGAFWKDASGHHRVPYLYGDLSGNFGLYLGIFDHGWTDKCCLLCFCDLPAEECELVHQSPEM